MDEFKEDSYTDEWVLLTSPYESPTNKWKIEIFPNQESVEKIIHNRDLTKTFFALPVKELVCIVAEEFEKE